MRRIPAILFLFLLTAGACFPQSDSSSAKHSPNRKIILVAGSAGVAAGSLIYLNQAWYSQYSSGNFHSFNDNMEWLQMDKAGHAFTTYQTSRLMMEAFEWAGFRKNQQLYIGGAIGLAYMTAIEIMDGYSEGWGYSWGDQIANVTGCGLAIAQQAVWNEQRIGIRFSFSQSGLAKYNPSLLGKNISTQLLKDYNGQTYWLEANPSCFMKKDTRFPKWLNIAVGYSAWGMLGGHYNNITVQDETGNVLRFDRERRLYLSVDVDWTRIRTRSKALKTLFSVMNVIKIPAPALRFSKSGMKAHYLYF